MHQLLSFKIDCILNFFFYQFWVNLVSFSWILFSFSISSLHKILEFHLKTNTLHTLAPEPSSFIWLLWAKAWKHEPGWSTYTLCLPPHRILFLKTQIGIAKPFFLIRSRPSFQFLPEGKKKGERYLKHLEINLLCSTIREPGWGLKVEGYFSI